MRYGQEWMFANGITVNVQYSDSAIKNGIQG